MPHVAIFTDSTVQFPQPSFQGRHLVRIIPLSTSIHGKEFDNRSLKVSDLPGSADESANPCLVIPDSSSLESYFLGERDETPFNQAIGIFTSAHLSSLWSAAAQAASRVNGRIDFQVIDSHSISIGLGVLVQLAAEAAMQNSSLAEIENLIRSAAPRIYAVLCTPGLSYLWRSGFVDRGQATVGEMLSLLPIFAIEEGHLTPLEKVRNQRQLLDFYQEFIDEFENIQHIAFIQGTTHNPQNGRLLREHVQETYPRTPFTEHMINLPFATLMGPQASALFVIESSGHRSKNR